MEDTIKAKLISIEEYEELLKRSISDEDYKELIKFIEDIKNCILTGKFDLAMQGLDHFKNILKRKIKEDI